MCDPVSIHNHVINQNNQQQFIQQGLDFQNQLTQQQLMGLNSTPKFKPMLPALVRIDGSVKQAFRKRTRPSADEFQLKRQPEEKIPGINCPGIHRGPDGKIDGIIGGMTEDGNFIHVSPADDRIGGRTSDGKMWDGVRVRPKKPIPGINVPGIHRDPDGKVDGIIGGITENGDFIHVSPADDRIGGRTADGKMWDGVKV